MQNSVYSSGNGIADCSTFPITPDAVAERFTRAPRARVQEIFQALETLGFINQVKRG